ncbi:hypothetical protein B0H14DRAFT_2636824 [Mycena olivaceomarginata]|nr:hypothetical protein B0H14DRAFT_2636824 [Mycena olivaceomarginata]
MPNPSLKLKQPPHKPKKAVSEHHRQQKRSLALRQYAERQETPNAETLREKAREQMKRLRATQKDGTPKDTSSDRCSADFNHRERKRRQKYMENYGAQSYQDFYYSLLKFFGEGHLAGVTIIDQTKFENRRSPKNISSLFVNRFSVDKFERTGPTTLILAVRMASKFRPQVPFLRTT